MALAQSCTKNTRYRIDKCTFGHINNYAYVGNIAAKRQQNHSKKATKKRHVVSFFANLVVLLVVVRYNLAGLACKFVKTKLCCNLVDDCLYRALHLGAGGVVSL